MIATAKSFRCHQSPAAWHADFEAMMPVIDTYAKIAFRHLNPEAREEAVEEVLCNACCAYARLVELNKADLAYPRVLARFGVAQTREGRKVGGRLNIHDVMSPYCRSRKKVVLEQLDTYDPEEDCWQEVLLEDRRAGPAETAAIRVDFPSWLQVLPSRMQKIATFLAQGETTTAAAEEFGVSRARISQIRRELYRAWSLFQGEELVPAIT